METPRQHIPPQYVQKQCTTGNLPFLSLTTKGSWFARGCTFGEGRKTFRQTSNSSVMEVANTWNWLGGRKLRQYTLPFVPCLQWKDFQVLLIKVLISLSCAYKPFSSLGHGKAIDHVLRRRWRVPIKSLVGVQWPGFTTYRLLSHTYNIQRGR